MTGPATKVDYWQGFLKYKKLAENLSRIAVGRRTLKAWNDVVFKGIRSSESTESTERLDTFDSMEAEIEARELLEQAFSRGGTPIDNGVRETPPGNDRSASGDRSEDEGK